jgi:hypothetical protein
MGYDLKAGLGHLGEELAGDDALPVDLLVAQARRRRKVRTATYGAVGVGTAAAVTVGGMTGLGLLDRREPVPPATPTQEPTPTPSSEVRPAWMDVEPAVCGEVLDVEQAGLAEAPLTASVPGGAVTLDLGEAVSVTVSLTASDQVVPDPWDSLSAVLVDEGGSVVGLSTLGDASTVEACPDAPDLAATALSLYVLDPTVGATDDGAASATPHLAFGGPWPVEVRAAVEDPSLPALADLVITPQGMGPLLVGGPVADAQPVVRWEEDLCVTTEGETVIETRGGWVSGYGDDPFDAPFSVIVDRDAAGEPVFAVEVVKEGPHTEGGIQVGSTLAELQAAHPEVRLATPSDGGPIEVWVVEQGSGALVFEVSVDTPDYPWEPGVIKLIRARSTSPVYDSSLLYRETCG